MGREDGKGMMGHGKGMGPGRHMMQAMREMLSAQQPAALRELMQAHRPVQMARMGHPKNVREDMKAESQKERPDPDTVHEIHGRMTEIHFEMMAKRARMRNAMYDLLTEEQREQLRDEVSADPDAAEDHEAHHGEQ
ncbi:Spy/CpxP family protein refolding chaperone [Thioalkalivibrio sp.]|uniref:Spy/CpxP family protein refolding chaperone n=2 Tax=Thioalkalivibrio sp. TaxID=2093813 RepID=UPI003567982C